MSLLENMYQRLVKLMLIKKHLMRSMLMDKMKPTDKEPAIRFTIIMKKEKCSAKKTVLQGIIRPLILILFLQKNIFLK